MKVIEHAQFPAYIVSGGVLGNLEGEMTLKI